MAEFAIRPSGDGELVDVSHVQVLIGELVAVDRFSTGAIVVGCFKDQNT